MILPPLLKPTHPVLEVAASDAFVVAVDAEVAADCCDAAAFVSDVFAALALVAAALFDDSAAAALLLLHGPLSMPFLRWKTLTEPTTRPVRLTCWRHVLRLQHRLHELPPRWLMHWHRWLIFRGCRILCNRGGVT